MDKLAFILLHKPSPSSVLSVKERRSLREDIPIASKCHPLFVERTTRSVSQ